MESHGTSIPTSALDGQIAVISGGLGDIGSAICKKLVASGADIAIGDILDPQCASAHLRELKGLGRRAQYTSIDISEEKAVEGWIDNVEKTLGLPNLIICNAAIVSIGNPLTLATDDWTRTLRVNLDGAFFLARAAASRLVARQKPGRIIFIGSWAAHAPHPQIIAYCVAKAGLRMLCKCMAIDLAKHNILVNEVAPGYVDGGLVRQWYAEDPALRARDAARVPLRRLIEPDEVAAEVCHLCDPSNRHMTGSVVLLDGGLSLVAVGQSE